MHREPDLVAAPAAPLVLAVLAEGEHDGYAILKRVRELSDDELEWADGMLYPLLHRLRRLGYVTADWRTGEGQRRRYYAISPTGRSTGGRRHRAGASPSPGDHGSRLLILPTGRVLGAPA